MWNLSARAMILSLQDFANRQRTTFSLHNIFFQTQNIAKLNFCSGEVADGPAVQPPGSKAASSTSKTLSSSDSRRRRLRQHGIHVFVSWVASPPSAGHRRTTLAAHRISGSSNDVAVFPALGSGPA